MSGFFTSFEEPAFEKLLPDATIDPQNPRPYTLIIDLDKFIVCHIWDVRLGEGVDVCAKIEGPFRGNKGDGG